MTKTMIDTTSGAYAAHRGAALAKLAPLELKPEDAVRSYHGALQKLSIKPQRTLAKDLEQTVQYSAYAASPSSPPPLSVVR